MNSHPGVKDRDRDRISNGMANIPGLASVVAYEAAVGAAMPETRQWRGNETILLVEDEAFVRHATGEALRSAGYRVLTAASATQALEAYHNCSQPVDLLLADVVMPGVRGDELAQTLFVLCPQVRIMLMSGYIDQLALCKPSIYRPEYLAKPFSISTLLERVRAALDGNPFDLEPPSNLRSLCGSA